MIIGIHQPNYLPYLGFFDKIRRSDIFVILDDAQFSKGDFHNRNRIKTANGSKWVTIPVIESFKPINETHINFDLKFGKSSWNEYHLNLIQENYKKALFFNKLFPRFKEFYSLRIDNLAINNIQLILLFCELFRINTPIHFSSTLNLKSCSSQRLIDICKYFDADTYLSGQDGPNYMNLNLFNKSQIQVKVQNFKHPVYNQLHNDFLPFLSSLDALLNEGNIFDII